MLTLEAGTQPQLVGPGDGCGSASSCLRCLILGIADMLSDGIITQFPAKFAR
jgi:hypothetical protein